MVQLKKSMLGLAFNLLILLFFTLCFHCLCCECPDRCVSVNGCRCIIYTTAIVPDPSPLFLQGLLLPITLCTFSGTLQEANKTILDLKVILFKFTTRHNPGGKYWYMYFVQNFSMVKTSKAMIVKEVLNYSLFCRCFRLLQQKEMSNFIFINICVILLNCNDDMPRRNSGNSQ